MPKSLIFLALFLVSAKASAGIDARCVSRLENGENRYRTKISGPALRKLSFGMDQVQARLSQDRYVLLVDYSKRSSEKRSFLIDTKACDIVSSDYVIHGGSTYSPQQHDFGDPDGDGILNHCTHSNGSRKFMTRPGLYMTGGCHHTLRPGWTNVMGTCQGVKLIGLQASNQDAFRSGVVLHEHENIPNDNSVKLAGQGCPAYPPGKLKALMRYGMFRGAMMLVYAPQCENQTPIPPNMSYRQQPAPRRGFRYAQ